MFYQLLWTFILGLHDCNYVICLILQHTCLVCYDSYQHITYLAFIMLYAYYLQQEYNRSYQVIFWVFFFNYIMYIQHNICSMNMKHCKKKRNHRGIMRLISNKNRSIAEIKRTRFTRFQVYRTIKRNLSIPLPPPSLPVEL